MRIYDAAGRFLGEEKEPSAQYRSYVEAERRVEEFRKAQKLEADLARERQQDARRSR